MRFSSGTFTLSPTNGDMSQATVTATATTDGAGDVRRQRFVAIQATATGAPVGSIKLRGSVDGTTFSDMGSASAISAASTTAWDIIDSGFAFFQVLYTKTSGTGTLAVKFSAKGE